MEDPAAIVQLDFELSSYEPYLFVFCNRHSVSSMAGIHGTFREVIMIIPIEVRRL